MATPMATQLTYEGLLDEVFGLSCGQVRVEAEGEAKWGGWEVDDKGRRRALVPWQLQAQGAMDMHILTVKVVVCCLQATGARCTAHLQSQSHSHRHALCRPPAEVVVRSCSHNRIHTHAATLFAGPGRKVYGLNSADAVFKETRDRFYIGARKWLNETLRCAAAAAAADRMEAKARDVMIRLSGPLMSQLYVSGRLWPWGPTWMDRHAALPLQAQSPPPPCRAEGASAVLVHHVVAEQKGFFSA